MNLHRKIGVGCAIAGALLLCATLGLAAPAGAATPLKYVSLGDSYTSAPNVGGLATGAPLDCLQSSGNYPHLVSQHLGAALADVSCAGADVQNMTSAQYLDQPPQFNALSPSTQIVTLGIGGNDNNTFVGAIAACFTTDVLDIFNIGAPCKSVFGSSFVNNIASDASNIAAAIVGIHERSPGAKVFVVGYPDILPQSSNCFFSIPLTTGDVAYLNNVEVTLNNMLRTQATSNGATFVDTFMPSIGHDACKSARVRYVEPVISGSSGIILHPNTAGESADSVDVLNAMSAAGVH